MTISSVTIYTAPWCTPCKALKPRLEVFVKSLNLPFHVVDTSDEDGDYQFIKTVPTVKIDYKNNETAYLSNMPFDKLSKLINDGVAKTSGA
jgi:thiol-disulfide isomerase/thioredoxin